MTLIRRLAPAAAIGALAAAFCLPVAAQTPAPEPAPAASAEATAPQILPDLWLGAEDAPVDFIEYASFTCSHCADFSTEVFPKLKAEYIDTGKVRFAQRDVYFDDVGLWAGILARCGDESKFYPVSGMLFETQREWLSAKNGEELAANLRKIGAKAGYSAEQMDACWKDEAKVQSLVATFQQNAVADKVEGTPTFLINGETVRNMPWDQLKAKLDEKLAAAK